MIISIWLIFVLIAGAGFLFYYKKNKHKIPDPIIENKTEKAKHNLTNIDKMLDNITKKEIEKTESVLQDETENKYEHTKTKEEIENKSEFDIKSGIISSIILKRKDDLS